MLDKQYKLCDVNWAESSKQLHIQRLELREEHEREKEVKMILWYLKSFPEVEVKKVFL